MPVAIESEWDTASRGMISNIESTYAASRFSVRLDSQRTNISIVSDDILKLTSSCIISVVIIYSANPTKAYSGFLQNIPTSSNPYST